MFSFRFATYRKLKKNVSLKKQQFLWLFPDDIVERLWVGSSEGGLPCPYHTYTVVPNDNLTSTTRKRIICVHLILDPEMTQMMYPCLFCDCHLAIYGAALRIILDDSLFIITNVVINL